MADLLGLFSRELIFGGAIIGGNFAFQNVLGLTKKKKKNSVKHNENSLKQLKTASTNSPWTYIQEGLLSEAFLRLRFGGVGLFSGGLIFFGGGAYYRNFTVY